MVVLETRATGLRTPRSSTGSMRGSSTTNMPPATKVPDPIAPVETAAPQLTRQRPTRQSLTAILVRSLQRRRESTVKVARKAGRSMSVAIRRASLENVLKFPRRLTRARSTPDARRLSMFLGTVNRREKIVQRFILHMQLGVLQRQTTRMHAADGRAHLTIQARDMEKRVGDWTLDGYYRTKNLQIFLNAMFGLAVALWEMQVSWAASTVGAEADWTAGDGQARALGVTSQSTILKLIVSSSTLVLVCQVVDLYRLFLKEKHGIWGDADSSAAAASPQWDASLLVPLTIEVCILAVHPLPFLEDVVHQAASCIMFVRLYLAARVYRDHADVFKLRKEIIQNCFLHSSSPVFDWALPLKVAFEVKPLRVIVLFFVVILAAFSISIYVLERQYQPLVFTLGNSTWFTFCQLNLHKTDIHAHTWKGRFATAGMIVWGVLFETVLVVAILHKIGLDDKDKLMLSYIQRTEYKNAIERAARRTIRQWMRWRLAVRPPSSPVVGHHPSTIPSSLRRTIIAKSMVVLPAAAKAKQLEAAYWNAVEKLRQTRNAQEIAVQTVADPVLEKLQAIEADLVKIKAAVDQPKCPDCGGLLRSKKASGDDADEQSQHDDTELARLLRRQEEIDAQYTHIQHLLSRVA
ncbi:Aste57867_2073 [Aphanomyces stellatus]|uniref:Aste57867_2073 protein n=1 Tax=Aphanomyces stellatus TaxID=120398 RepID=A0A485K6T8_9STRA|nr:hypothetical protein As57867_002069 [Aphanomyces stellatus]VFT79276.1 Aste57867_2073 [Aphanomyces stellatus]